MKIEIYRDDNEGKVKGKKFNLAGDTQISRVELCSRIGN